MPIWSSVYIFGYDDNRLKSEVARIRQGIGLSQMKACVNEVRRKAHICMSEGRFRDAFDLIRRYPPDIRVAVKPFITVTIRRPMPQRGIVR